jgi:hypothetical protein
MGQARRPREGGVVGGAGHSESETTEGQGEVAYTLER